MYGYKVYINLFLYKIGLRHILPSAIVNNKQIQECGEPLVEFQGFRVRKSVANRLKIAADLLPKNYSIHILCGYRSTTEQKKQWQSGIEKLKHKFPNLSMQELENKNRKLCADPRNGFGPHQTGGAVDLTLFYKNAPVDMGGEYNSGINSKTYSHNITPQQKQNRQILICAMRDAGFQNYPNEWWHWSYGDRAYAAYKHEKFAIYGKIN